MVMVFEGTPEQYSIDGYLHQDLCKMKEQIKNDWDFVCIIDGLEGAGKSLMAQQQAKFVDPTFDLSRIVFNPYEFRKKCLELPKYSAIVFDEAFRGLSSRRSMSSMNVMLNQIFNEVRQRNLFIFIVIPSFFELDKYPAIHRSRYLCHVYTNKGQRGFFRMYNRECKKILYLRGKEGYNYNVRFRSPTGYAKKLEPSYYGRFVNHYTVDEKAYRQKKQDSMKPSKDEAALGVRESYLRKKIMIMIEYLEGQGFNHLETANILNMDRRELTQFKYTYKKALERQLLAKSV